MTAAFTDKMKKYSSIFLLFLASTFQAQVRHVWSKNEAATWYKEQGWIVGCNFIPSTAINEIEMWQPDTFDPITINRELGWAHSIGMNTVRVFLHYIPWRSDSIGYTRRLEEFLTIGERNAIRTIFVFFDDCWNNDPHPGKQPDPRPGIHNSGWVQCPGKTMHDKRETWNDLKKYEQGILKRFKTDKRILMWDLFNEPGNSNYGSSSMALLKSSFAWAWEIRPLQPITAGIWYENRELNQWQLDNSDVITFHSYDSAAEVESEIIELKQTGRPVICTEYMARTRGSKFQTHLPIFKKYLVGAINWGLVAGKTNTIYQWGVPVADGSEPKIWFHDIFRKDGEPFDREEVRFISEITGAK